MSKVKRFAIIMSTLSLAAVATAGLADSNCGTDISANTATCLSQTATTNFIDSYRAYLGGQTSIATFSNPNRSDNAYYAPVQQQVSNTTANPPSTKPNSSKQSSNWF